jgi:hypothetical protein
MLKGKIFVIMILIFHKRVFDFPSLKENFPNSDPIGKEIELMEDH